MNNKAFAILSTVIVIAFIIESIRREKMTFKFAFAWLSGGLCVLMLAIFDGFLARISQLAGFAVLSNFIFFLFLLFTVFLSLLLTIYANEQNKRSEVLAQNVAILEHRIRTLESPRN